MAEGIIRHIRLRAHKKIRPLLPIVLGSAILFGLLFGLIAASFPLLPAPYQQLVTLMREGQWAAGREQLTAILNSFGATREIAFITLQILQVLAAPIPGQLLGLVGGYLFGFWQGLALTMLGLTIGSSMAIGIGRIFGERIVRKVVPSRIFATFDTLVQDGGLWNFFMIFLLPALPDDAVCLIAGLTRLAFWKLVLVCAIGRLPGMAVLTFVGAHVSSNLMLANVILGFVVVGAAILWFFSEEVEAQVSALLPRNKH